MKTRIFLVLGVGAMLAATAGCQQSSGVYGTYSDYNSIESSAGLVVSGNITDVQAVNRFRGSDIAAAGLGNIDSSCVAQQQARMYVQKTYKGTAANGPLTFYYYGPCYRPSKAYTPSGATPSILPGTSGTIYLQNRSGQWWMIGHQDLSNQRTEPRYGEEGYIKQREEIY